MLKDLYQRFIDYVRDFSFQEAILGYQTQVAYVGDHPLFPNNEIVAEYRDFVKGEQFRTRWRHELNKKERKLLQEGKLETEIFPPFNESKLPHKFAHTMSILLGRE